MRMNRIVRSMFCATRCWTGFMLCAGNMNPDYLWVDGSEARKSPKLLLFLFEEFYSFDEIPKALCDILDACQSGIRELEQELKKPAGKVIALPSQPALKQKEAA